MTQQSSTNQQSSFILSGTSSVGGYSINAAAGTLSPYYITAVQNLCGAYATGGPNSSMFQSQLETFAESYGSSYVKTFYYGGYAASVLQMSSSSYSTLQNQSVSLSAAASVTFIQSGGSVSGSYSGDMSVGEQVQSMSSTFQYIQIPSSTLVALTSSGNIDCTSWTANLNQTANDGILAPMSYTVGSQQNILLGYPYLFGSPCTQSILSGVAAEMQTYFSSCSNSQVGCPPPGVCPTGSYAYITNTTSGAFTCVYCYDQNNPQLSPMCNIQNTQSCGYQQCNCFSGYSSESQCNADSNPSPGGTCQTSFIGYGCATTNIVNQCTSGSNPVISYCELDFNLFYALMIQNSGTNNVIYLQKLVASSAGSTNSVCSCQCCTKSGCSSVAANCPNPPPQPSSPPSSCFPADAVVQVSDGQGSGAFKTYSKEMKELRIGDRVLASRPDGSLFYDEIYMFGHKEPSQRAAFVRLETDSGHVLAVTPDHHVFVVRNSTSMEIPAGKALIADQLYVAPQNRKAQHDHLSLESIVSITMSKEKGLYNPYTLSGTIVVNRILASVHSSSALDQFFDAFGIPLPLGYQALFAPVRLLYRSLGARKMASLEWIIDGVASVMNQPPS